jgi:hypothetical protein
VKRIVIRASSEAQWEQWDDFVRASSSGCVYQQSAWLKALAHGLGQDVRVYAICDACGILAGAAVKHAERYHLRVARKPWATAYSGVLTGANTSECGPAKLFSVLSKEYSHFRVVQAPGASPNGFAGLCADLTVRKTPLLDISNLDALWRGFDRKVRQRVRKAAKLGVTVTEVSDANSFYELYTKTYERQGIPMPLSREQICETLGMARRAGIVRLFLACTRAGDPAAALVTGEDARRAYFMLAASHPQLRKTDAMSLMWWHVMRAFAATHKEIDLVGHGVASIDRFKRAFGPRLVDVFDFSCHASTVGGAALRTAAGVKNLMRSLRK